MKLLIQVIEAWRIAWDALRVNRLRSLLTTLGIVIGILTVTLMGTAIEGLNRAFLKSIGAIGADVLYVERRDWFAHSFEDWLKMHERRPITLDQAERFAEQVSGALAVAPIADVRRPVAFEQRYSQRVTVIGTTEGYLITGGVVISQGRFMTAGEARGGQPVCVLGYQVATNLFDRVSPLGKIVRIGAAPFEVIGILEKQGSFLGQFSLDNQVIIPITQLAAQFWHNPEAQIQVKAKSLLELNATKEEVRGVLRRVRRLAPGDNDDFSINQQESIVARFQKVAGTIAAVGLFITGLSLFVGAVGIMNIMFVSVAERTREIGIRKAIGARRKVILIQFMFEAMMICVLGGAIGLALAFPATLVLKRFMPATLSLTIVSVALGVAALTGIIAGLAPAWRAARLDPVEALRK